MRHTISCLHAIIIMGQLLKIIFSYIVCQSWLISSQGWSMLHMALSHAAVESRSDQECKSRNEHTLKEKKQTKNNQGLLRSFGNLYSIIGVTTIMWVDLRKGSSSPNLALFKLSAFQSSEGLWLYSGPLEYQAFCFTNPTFETIQKWLLSNQRYKTVDFQSRIEFLASVAEWSQDNHSEFQVHSYSSIKVICI